jgi:hypothetical protein
MSAVARPEVEIDGSTPEGKFALGLRALRGRKQLDYQTMAKIAHFAPSTLSKAASGNGLPTLDVTLAYVRACGGSEREWERKWRELYVTLERRRRALTSQSSHRNHHAERQDRRAGSSDEPDWERARKWDLEVTKPIPRVNLPALTEEEAGSAAEAQCPPETRATWGRRWLFTLVLVLVGALAGTSVTLAVTRSRTELSHPMPPTAGAASVQSFVIWDVDGSSVPLTVGETTRRLDLWNPNSTNLVVTKLNARPARLSGDSTLDAQRCNTEFVKLETVEQMSYRVDAGKTRRIEFKFSAPSLPENCTGRKVRVDYTGEAVQGTVVEGGSRAS